MNRLNQNCLENRSEKKLNNFTKQNNKKYKKHHKSDKNSNQYYQNKIWFMIQKKLNKIKKFLKI